MERVEKMIALVAILVLCISNVFTLVHVVALEQRVSTVENDQTQIIHSMRMTVDRLIGMKMQGMIE